MPTRDIGWWFWLATDLALATALLFDHSAIAAAIALAAIQVPVFAHRGGGLVSFPAQVRLAYLGLLVLGLSPPFHFIHWIQLVGTTAMVLVGYCLLARCLSLLPFNRIEPLTIHLICRTFFSWPVRGAIPTPAHLGVRRHHI